MCEKLPSRNVRDDGGQPRHEEKVALDPEFLTDNTPQSNKQQRGKQREYASRRPVARGPDLEVVPRERGEGPWNIVGFVTLEGKTLG